VGIGTRLNLGLTVLALSFATGAALRWQRAIGIAGTATFSPIVPTAVLFAFSPDSALAAAAVTVAHDPFRLANKPAVVSYVSSLVTITPPQRAARAAAPRPALAVRAIIGGPPWSALMDGLPGQPPNTVVNPGSVFANLRVQSITSDSVIVQGSDTTWRLSIAGSGE